MIQNAIAATEFRKVLIDADMPVATNEQLKRAKRLIEGNPMLRSKYSPLGLQMLALRIPLSKRERKEAKLQPSRYRGTKADVEANSAAVEAFVKANPTMTQLEAAETIVRGHGYTDPRFVLGRVQRTLRSPRQHRICGHIANKMRCLSAVAQSAKLIAARDENAKAIG